ncbi:DUF3885 domain-containing protein [Enterococcus gilvus]|uniref:DUF3885 domain-containing protein n=1 Tax=Enterococcus gilvus TaxID=160453 RepID=UPI002906CD00|nr:DUF3885 domain-containing protein [Enterococcus gilvus]MDU5511793.1 DUF3885 domain-containing protein [Enterococcus gilvus]
MNKKIRNIYLNYHHTYPLKENIRLELAHGTHSTQFENIENAKHRAMTLFNDVFKDSETVQIILFVSQYSKKTRIASFLQKNKFRVIDSFTTDSWKDYCIDTTTVLVIETKKENLRTAKLIDGLCYQDFYDHGKLRIKIPLVLYNFQDNLLLNIYDDRGCDIWSDNLVRQKEIYQKYNSWILEYDRKKISSYYDSIL